MCGRFVRKSSPAALVDRFHAELRGVDPDASPEYNVAPREQVLIVRERDTREGERERVLSSVRWGLIPSWAKDPKVGDRQINARAEGLAEKPAYRKAFTKRRCLIPADGFYEWQVVGPPKTPKGRPPKQPVFVHPVDDQPVAFAGLWEPWKIPDDVEIEGGGDDGWLRTCTIITTKANQLLEPIHDRMPVVLPESEWARWLDPTYDDTGPLAQLLVPAPEDLFEVWPVSTLVNKADVSDPALIEPLAPPPG